MLAQVVLFTDTEFTCFKNPKLISIGIVASSGAEFYEEAEYQLDECSDFVRATVLPLLNKRALSLKELQSVLIAWIDSLRNSGPIIICCESEYDREMLEQIFGDRMPQGVVLRNLGTSYVDKIKRYEFHVKYKQTEHHALHDARALKYSFRGWIKKVR
jgi:hypothetical protein